MSAQRTERLLNLLIALLNSRYGLRRSELREKIYAGGAASDAAFGRMFERDKNDLRDFGFDVETVTDLGWSSDDPGTTRYRIGKESNRLPDVELTPDEWTVLLLASQLWEQAALGTAAGNALRKLQAAGGLADVELPAGVQPRIKPAGQAFEDLVAAMHAQHAVRFRYLAGSTGREAERVVEPWGLGSRFGQWYLVGFDRGRSAKRFFRLSRFTSAVTILEREAFTPPAGFNVRAELNSLPELPVSAAVVDVRSGKLLGLRKRAAGATPSSDTVTDADPDADTGTEAGAGWDRLTVPYRDAEVLGEELASYGPNVRVVAPAELSAAVQRRLANAAAFIDTPVPSYSFGHAGTGKRTRKRTSEDQLKRMLQLVPFLVRNQGLPIEEVADRFGVTRQELEGDLLILICSGLPQGYPDELLDIQWEEGHVFISQSMELNRPVRFTVDEACALLTGLETLNGLPELAEGSALESVTLKLMAAAGEEGLRAAALSGPEVGPGNSANLEVIRDAIESGSQLHLVYLSAQKDTLSERDVDPLRLYSMDNTWYFEAYCHSAAGLRNFRLDRIEDLAPTGKPVSSGIKPDGGFPAKLFTPNDDDTLVTVQLTARGAGLADDYYAERTAPLPGGGLVAEIRFGNTAWLPMFVAQHGGTARILEPEALTRASRDWIAAALAQYNG
ncbi:helix-turn-helix transcriptional regulator [Arthrobacter globiformis]|uniref:helix-turn-helix transcriptional regulator n=1 Tax=Arthrobacter globiformis TaxID=1665 RepID=UPI0027D8CF1E|nr:WYL domain-containing protein [Arthrobacter globiformis]